jgi:hypothetical protein
LLPALHLGCALLLLVSHGAFFLRGLAIDRRGARPALLDRWARGLAQALLPVTALTGLIVLQARGSAFVPHGLVGLLPLAAVPLVFLGRLLTGRRRQLPWLLPALNLVLIIGGAVTGFLWRPAAGG